MDKGLNDGSTDSYPFIGMGLNKINITFVCSTKLKFNKDHLGIPSSQKIR